ncbi:MAG: hypothetical protein HYY31_00375, partial [Chloroflexi bacterium]|nr:hypothetical protein [Chloroflexota bacterium]
IPQTVNTVPLDELTALDEQEVTERLLEELRRSLAYYQERTINPRVLPLVLSGGHPILEGDALAQAIQRNLSITPIVPKLPFSYPTDFPVHAYLANLGTLLR